MRYLIILKVVFIISFVFSGCGESSENTQIPQEVVSRADSLLEEGNTRAVLKALERYDTEGAPIADSLHDIARADTLAKNLRPGYYKEAIRRYQKAVELAPKNLEYREELRYYKDIKNKREGNEDYIHSDSWAEETEKLAYWRCKNYVVAELGSSSISDLQTKENSDISYNGDGEFKISGQYVLNVKNEGAKTSQYLCRVTESGGYWHIKYLDFRVDES